MDIRPGGHFDFAKTGTWLLASRFWHRLFKIGIQLV
jgi:hypothetical protein